MKLRHNSMRALHKQSVYLPPRSYTQNTAFALLSLLQKLQQSVESLTIGEGLRISLTTRPGNLFGGTGNSDNLCLIRSLIRALYIQKFETSKEQIKARYGKKNYTRSQRYIFEKNELENILNSDNLAKEKGLEYMREQLGIEYDPEHMLGMETLRKFEATLLGKYRLFVYCSVSARIVYRSIQSEHYPIISLTYDSENQHYEVLKNFRTQYNGIFDHFCKLCGAIVSQKLLHQDCSEKCIFCQKPSQCEYIDRTSCLNCKITFPNRICFENHFVNGRCLAYRYRCLDCNDVKFCRPQTMESHVCHPTYFCIRCQDYQENPVHKCSWKKPSERVIEETKKATKKFKYAFFDLETRVNEVINDEIKWTEKQTVTHAVVQMICQACAPAEYDPECATITKGRCQCEKNPIIFSENDGENVLERLGNFIFFDRKMNERTLFAHNSSRFDTHFLLEYCLKKNIVPSLIVNGQSIMMMKTERVGKKRSHNGNVVDRNECVVNTLKVMDTCLYASIPLSKFAACFQLEEGKDLFPVFANCDYFKTPREWPGSKFYNADNKSKKEREEILKFIEEQRQNGVLFNLEEEIVKYCVQDVMTLMKGAMKFRKHFIDVGRVDPFRHDVTLAGACLRVFRLFHNDYEIETIPENGYKANQNYSRSSIKWLEWEAAKRGVRIRHAENDGEVEVYGASGRKYRVDGYYEEDGRKICLEFSGCYWHHHNCLTGITDIGGKPFGTAYIETMMRFEDIKAAGYIVENIWECEANELLKIDKEMKTFFDKVKVYGPLRPREAMKGGRTGSLNLLLPEKEGRRIYYVDVKSLYPFIQCTVDYPLGPPNVMNKPKNDDVFMTINKEVKEYNNGIEVTVQRTVQQLKIRGLIYATVLPPQDNYIALLPVRHKKQLFYTLCRRCMEQYSENGKNIYTDELVCKHNEQDRSLTDVWYSDELQMALDYGYEIQQVSEVWSWTNFTSKGESLIDRQSLFGKYFQTFFKEKEENSGYPANVITEEEKEEFLQNFEMSHGIRLDREKMEQPNKSLRYVSKLACNSLWGRFAMKTKRTNYTFAKTKEQVDKIWHNTSIVIKDDKMMNHSDVWCFIWEAHNDSIHSSEYGSLIIGIVTLSCARTHLTRLMLEVEGTGRLKRSKPILSYHDTDSLMLKSDCKEEEEVIQRFLSRHMGEKLGELTNELNDGYEGVELVSPGGKQYLLRTKNKETGEYRETIRLRGFSQNYSTSSILTRDNLFQKTSELQDGAEGNPLTFQTSTIRKKMGHVSTVSMNKHYIARNVKGILADYVVYPFGYRF